MQDVLPDLEEEELGAENYWSDFPIDELPVDILGVVFSFVVPKGKDSLRIVLRTVCRLWNEVASLSRYETRRFRISAGDTGFQTASDARALDALKTSRNAGSVALLFDAAELGNEGLCKLAQEWRGKTKFSEACLKRALFIAAEAGRENVCTLFKEWVGEGPDKTLPLPYATEMCRGAALSGHVSLCAKGKRWCSSPHVKKLFKVAVYAGALGGHGDICDLWDSGLYEREPIMTMQKLMGSAKGGHEDLFKQTYTKGMTLAFSGSAGLSVAAQNGHEELCLAALLISRMPQIEWANTVLWGAAQGGWGALCELALTKGARGLDHAIQVNMKYGGHAVRLVLESWRSKLEWGR